MHHNRHYVYMRTCTLSSLGVPDIGNKSAFFFFFFLLLLLFPFLFWLQCAEMPSRKNSRYVCMFVQYAESGRYNSLDVKLILTRRKLLIVGARHATGTCNTQLIPPCCTDVQHIQQCYGLGYSQDTHSTVTVISSVALVLSPRGRLAGTEIQRITSRVPGN